MLILILLCFFGSPAVAAERTWQFDPPGRVVAIGDLHGDFQAFFSILRHTHLIDVNLNWTGGDAYLVTLGDICGRGDHSRAIIDLLLTIEEQAAQTQGRVVSIMGNHEAFILQGDARFVTSKGLRQYHDFASISLDRNALTLEQQNVSSEFQPMFSAFHGETKYARWLRRNLAVAKLGEALFVHAGFDDNFRKDGASRVNALQMQWINYYQGRGPQPPPESSWVFGAHGPLLNTLLPDEILPERYIDDILTTEKAKRIFVGHKPTASRRIEHRYHGRVRMLDTLMGSTFKNGQVSAVEINGEKITQHNNIPRLNLPPSSNCGASF